MINLTPSERQLFEEVRNSRILAAKTFKDPIYSGLLHATSDIYPDPAHFVYELLQNADDVEASEVSFTLDSCSLYFIHNGKIHFNITSDKDKPLGHINSITAYKSSKDDSHGNQIGKFGLGFKSVFVYSDAPQIYDDKFWFKIEDQIVPSLLDKDHPMRKRGETLFVFNLKNPKDDYNEIHKKLTSLDEAMLFLHHVNSIKFFDKIRNKEYVYEEIHEKENNIESTHYYNVTLKTNNRTRRLILFNKKIDFFYYKEREISISVAFYLNNNGNIDTNTSRGICCFFPTSDTFDLPYTCHAPFLLTSNRQNLKDEDFNRSLISHLAMLAAEAVYLLTKEKNDKKQALINENILKFIPKPSYWASYESSYYNRRDKITSDKPFYDSFTKLLKEKDVFLAWGNNYYKACDVVMAPDELRRLITREQLAILLKRKDCGFFRYSGRYDDDEQEYLTDVIGIKAFDANEMALKITAGFMAEQSYEWIVKFYHFLKASARLTWSPVDGRLRYIHSNAQYPIRYAPIIKTQKGEWVAPYVKILNSDTYSGNNEKLNVFFPVKHAEGQYNFIHRDFLRKEETDVIDFFKELGIKEPDNINYIETEILTHYEADSVNHSVILNDFEYLYTTLEKLSIKEREEAISKLKDKLKAITIDNTLAVISELYDNTPELIKYFASKEGIIIDIDFYKKSQLNIVEDDIRKFFYEFGLWKRPKILINNLNESEFDNMGWDYQIRLRPTDCTSINNIEDRFIEGFEAWYKEGFTEEVSRILWNYLCIMPIREHMTATIRYFYRTNRTTSKESSLIYQLRNYAWINIKGRTCKPKDVYREELLDAGYENSIELFELFGIYKKNKSIKELGGTEEQQKDYELGRQIREEGITEEDIKELKRIKQERESQIYSKRKEAEQSDSSFIPEGNLPSASLEEMFNDPVNSNKKSNKTLFKNIVDNNEEIAQLRKKLEEDNEREIERISLLQQRAKMEKYSFEWFVAGLQEEYASTSEESKDEIAHAISISFSSVRIDSSNSRIFILDSASRDIPQWLEDINDINVNFLFNNRKELSYTFEVASVRDQTLRLKAKAGDEKELSRINWPHDCTMARIDLNNPINLVDNLRRAFMALELDGFNLKEALDDHISFIYGPPGTGKTTYLATQVISKLMAENEKCRILVLTPTNKACDVIAHKLLVVDEESMLWMRRFVASDDTELENEGYVCDRDTDVYLQDKCCLISTIARLPFDGFTTPQKTYLREIEWDYIVIDEASMISLPQIVYAIYNFELTKIIIAGDPKQIAPIDIPNIWEQENIYSMVELNSFKEPKTTPIQFDITNLTTQYRSIPAIGKLFSLYSYDGMLKHHRTSDSIKNLNIPSLPIKPITFIPFTVESIDNMYAAKKLAGSNIHIYSAVLTAEFARYLAKQYVANSQDKEIHIGVICPYISQAQLINKLIEQMSDIPEEASLTIGTIHSFQGDQCNVVLAVFNPPKGLKHGAGQAHINNQNIVNVAISRAQDYLCVIMPSISCEGYDNLIELKRLGYIANKQLNDDTGIIQPHELEQLMFGSPNYLNNNIFVTSHQIANVYIQPAAHYEVRCDEMSIDIQVDEKKSMVTYDYATPSKEQVLTEEKMIVTGDISTSKQNTDFHFKKLGEYRVGIAGDVDKITHLIKKYGGYKTSENIETEKGIYAGGYIIPYYNLERLLKSLKDMGWDISHEAKKIGFDWL